MDGGPGREKEASVLRGFILGMVTISWNLVEEVVAQGCVCT